jgi:hypothetical protein
MLSILLSDYICLQDLRNNPIKFLVSDCTNTLIRIYFHFMDLTQQLRYHRKLQCTMTIYLLSMNYQQSRDSSVGIWSTGWTIGVLGSIPAGGWEFFSSARRPERLWGPLSLLSNGYQGLFPWG